jgi:hypothetical protein
MNAQLTANTEKITPAKGAEESKKAVSDGNLILVALKTFENFGIKKKHRAALKANAKKSKAPNILKIHLEATFLLISIFLSFIGCLTGRGAASAFCCAGDSLQLFTFSFSNTDYI